HPESLPGTYVVPAPPFTHAFSRGDYALMRPDSPGQAWERIRIDALGEEEAVVVGADGIRRRVQPRTLAALEGTTPETAPGTSDAGASRAVRPSFRRRHEAPRERPTGGRGARTLRRARRRCRG